MKVVFLSGTYIQAPEGKPEFRLGAGSYFLQPGGNYRHTTTCDKASDCVFFVESKGPFDLKLVDAERGRRSSRSSGWSRRTVKLSPTCSMKRKAPDEARA